MKRKKVIITSAVLICAALISAGIFLAVRYHLENRITFPIADSLPDGNGRKATVIILAGQSNASGCSLDEYLKKNVTEEKYAEYQSGYDNVYINYLSGMKRSNEFVKCKTLQGEIDGGFGPELGLAEKLSEKYPDETFFIIKCSWGGTNLYEQWLSPSSSGKTGKYYKEFIAFVKTSINYLIEKNYDVKIEGICWMQGESDSFLKDTASAYKAHLSNFVGDVRKQLSKYASADGIAFIDAYIADNPVFWVEYKLINQAKLEFSQSSPMNALIDTIKSGLTTAYEPEGAPDIPHYDSLSEIKLGHLFAEQVSAFFD